MEMMIDNKLSLDKEDIVFVEGLQLLYPKSYAKEAIFT